MCRAPFLINFNRTRADGTAECACYLALPWRTAQRSVPATSRYLIDRGREVRLSRTPLPPNRTGGFPAYGSPVSRFLWTDRTEHGLLAGYRDPDRRSISPLTLSSKSVVSMLSVQTANEAHWPIAGGSTIGIAVNGTVIAT